MLITKAAIEALQVGFSARYREGYDNTPEYHQNMTTTIPSTHKSETYGWMTRILKMRKWDGPRLVQNLNTEAYTLINDTYENTVGVGVDEFDDDALGVYSPLMTEMGRTARKWPDQLFKTLIQSGTSTNSFDGVPFFAATHDVDPAGNQSNNFTSTALSAANYQTVRSAMQSYTGEDGEPLGVTPDLLAVPPQLERTGRTILEADMIPNDAGTAAQTNVLRSSARLLVVPELANEPTTWYLMDTSKGIRPFVWQLRKDPELVSKTDMRDDNVFHQDEYLWGVKARGAMGFGLWWLAARCIA